MTTKPKKLDAETSAKLDRYRGYILKDTADEVRAQYLIKEAEERVFKRPEDADFVLGPTSAAHSNALRGPDATLGRQVRDGMAAGGRATAAAHSPERQRRDELLQLRADEIWSNRPTLSISAVAKNLESEFGISFQTIRRKIKKK
jgi:hypothetical protein